MPRRITHKARCIVERLRNSVNGVEARLNLYVGQTSSLLGGLRRTFRDPIWIVFAITEKFMPPSR